MQEYNPILLSLKESKDLRIPLSLSIEKIHEIEVEVNFSHCSFCSSYEILEFSPISESVAFICPKIKLESFPGST